MKKIALLTLTVLPVLFAGSACKKEDGCPSVTQLGQLTWSEETAAWFPTNYLQQPATLEFESENGETLLFEQEYANILDGHFESFEKDCENGEGRTRVRWADIRYSGRFVAPNAMAIGVGMGVWNEKLAASDLVEADFYEWILLSLFSIKNGEWQELGRLRMVTNLRNAEMEDIDHLANEFEQHDNFEFMGAQYPVVFSSGDPDFEQTDIYLQKGKGVIGFTDENGVRWKLKE